MIRNKEKLRLYRDGFYRICAFMMSMALTFTSIDTSALESEISSLTESIDAENKKLDQIIAIMKNQQEQADKEKKAIAQTILRKLFAETGKKYANRNGGYTRIVKIGQRKGDAAMEVIIELV